MQPRPVWLLPRPTIQAMMAGVAVVGVVFGLMAALRASWLANERLGLQGTCYSSLNNIALAMSNYVEVHGRYPPPFATDDHGKRTHSWRIISLRWFYGDYPQAQSYNYHGQWDGIDNRTLSSDVPGWLRCPSEHRHNPHGSPFVMVNDFGDADPATIPANAILVIEA